MMGEMMIDVVMIVEIVIMLHGEMECALLKYLKSKVQ